MPETRGKLGGNIGDTSWPYGSITPHIRRDTLCDVNCVPNNIPRTSILFSWAIKTAQNVEGGLPDNPREAEKNENN